MSTEHNEHTGSAIGPFFTRRPPDEDGIAREALELLERMRVDVSQLRASIDLRERTERDMAARAARFMTDAATPDRAAFFFVPMATAPLVGLVPRGESPPRGVPSRPAKRLEEEAPPWNASTAPTPTPPPPRLRERERSKEKEKKREVPRVRAAMPRAVEKPDAETIPPPPLTHGGVECAVRAQKDRSGADETGGHADSSPLHGAGCTTEAYVRDQLRRHDLVSCDPAEGDAPIDDPVLNGIALRRLVSLAVGRPDAPPIDTAAPRTMDDVRRHYVAALSQLRDHPAFTFSSPSSSSPPSGGAGGVRLPPDARLLRPEAVVGRGETTALFALMAALLRGRRLPNWLPARHSYRPAEMSALEAAACRFLAAAAVLPDPAAHRLPPNASAVPRAAGAPFLAPPAPSPRRDAPPALYVPAVFPFLANGTALCDLVAHAIGERLPVHRNPRVDSLCAENAAVALDALRRCGPAQVSPLFLDDPLPIVRGDRRRILLLMEDIMRLAAGAPPRRGPPSEDAMPFLGDNMSHTGPEMEEREQKREKPQRSPPPPQQQPQLSPPQQQQQQQQKGSINKTPRCRIASPLVKRAEDGEGETVTLESWLRAALGTDFRYSAVDGSFMVTGNDPLLHGAQYLLFADGVILAHLIRTLERRRCDELEAIEMHPHALAAKRRNIRKCVTFLQTGRRILLDVPFIDEALLVGDRHGVLHVVRSLKAAYRFAVKD